MSERMNKLHAGQPVLSAGVPLGQAKAAMLLVHGRGGSAEDRLGLAANFAQLSFAYIAPQAAGNTGYPQRFLAPLAENEPWLSAALQRVGELVAQIEQAGIPAERIVLLGFSQGACLALEFAARNARRYGGVIGLSGALIGPPGLPRQRSGTLAETPIFLGCSDVDFHIPVAQVRESTQVLRTLGGAVTERIYPGLGHTVNEDELAFVVSMMEKLTADEF